MNKDRASYEELPSLDHGAKDVARDISEIMDVRSGSRLGPTFFFSDVKWGYGGSYFTMWGSSNAEIILTDQLPRLKLLRLAQMELWYFGIYKQRDQAELVRWSSHMKIIQTYNVILDQIKHEHDRAVNKVVFGGASGSWLLSGGQDGQMKLWVRTLELRFIWY